MAAFIAAAKALKKGATSREGPTESVIETTIKCPFDLDEIFKSDTERFSQLQDVIKYIFEQLNVSITKIDQVDMKMASKFMEISQ